MLVGAGRIYLISLAPGYWLSVVLVFRLLVRMVSRDEW